MRCEDVRERVDDYVDRVLPKEESARLEEHLASCAGCQRDVDALRALLRETAALPQSILPERDLWAGIEARLGTKSSVAFRLRRAVWRKMTTFAAAAAVLLIVAGILLDRVPSGTKRPGFPTRPEAPSNLAAETQRAEAEYARARQELLSALADHENALEPETRRVIEENLAIIDSAVSQVRTALAQDPKNVRLLRMLVAMQDQGLGLISLATKLSSNT